MSKKLAMVFGIVFIIVGVLGFIPNGLVGNEGIFHTNVAHDIVHLVVGIILVAVASKAAEKSALTLKVVGAIYLILAVIGFIMVSGSAVNSLLGVHLNAADNWLHLVLGIVLVAAGSKCCSKDAAPVAPAAPMQ